MFSLQVAQYNISAAKYIVLTSSPSAVNQLLIVMLHVKLTHILLLTVLILQYVDMLYRCGEKN